MIDTYIIRNTGKGEITSLSLDNIENINDFKPVAFIYDNLTSLLYLQKYQKEGFIYQVEDASGFTDIDTGKAWVKYKGTTVGDETDYEVVSKSDLGGAAWELEGNAGTDDAVNFIGTTDVQDLVFKTNNNTDLILRTSGTHQIASSGLNNTGFVLNGYGTGDRDATYQWATYGPSFANVSAEAFREAGENADFRLINYGTGKVHISTNGTNKRLTVDSVGNVGVGTQTPNEKLEVNGRIAISVEATGGAPNSVRNDGIDLFYTDGLGIEKKLIEGDVDAEYVNIENSGSATSRQTTLGDDAGMSNTGVDQTAIGKDAGLNNTGNNQVAVGGFAGSGNTKNSQAAFGYQAGQNNTGGNCTQFGTQSGLNNNRESQSVMGYRSGFNNTGAEQTAFGSNSGNGNTGANQTVLGSQSGALNSGSGQVAIGRFTGYNNSGLDQIAIGQQAGRENTANKAAFLGASAGWDGVNGNSKANVFVVDNNYIPSYLDRATAVADLTVINGCVAGNTYFYYNQTTFAIEGVRL